MADVSIGVSDRYDGNITIELRVRIDGRVFVARELLDEQEWLLQGDIEPYLEWFIKRSLGGIASTPDALIDFRRKLWIVHPDDQHDFRRCAESADVDVWPSCFDGVMLSNTTPAGGSSKPIAICPCRCHPRYGGSRSLPMFDEDSVQ